MTQFNLLPDVKLQYIRITRMKRLAVSISAVLTVISLVVFVGLYVYVDIAQTHHLTTLDTSIKSSTKTLEANADLNKILTLQNQLTTLPQLESQTPQTSRLFNFLDQVTPNGVFVSSVDIDYTQNTLSIEGNTTDLALVNQYVDTLKFTNYTTTINSAQMPAFSSVGLAAFTFDQGTTDPATYTITMNFDPLLFSDTETPTLDIPPNKITSNSVLSDPSNLFKQNSPTSSSGGSQ